MGWPFCPHCGTILDPPEFDEVKCTYCSFQSKFQDMIVGEVVTQSTMHQIETWAKNDIEIETEEMDKYTIIEEPCPVCGNPEQYFYTMQLRSADEGSTVFYECTKCSNKYSVNN
jgi:DNA-directed RNA polymerase I subunit RPA12